jgi:hypothetical protein
VRQGVPQPHGTGGSLEPRAAVRPVRPSATKINHHLVAERGNLGA